jgi:hypothetical protein
MISKDLLRRGARWRMKLRRARANRLVVNFSPFKVQTPLSRVHKVDGRDTRRAGRESRLVGSTRLPVVKEVSTAREDDGIVLSNNSYQRSPEIPRPVYLSYSLHCMHVRAHFPDTESCLSHITLTQANSVDTLPTCWRKWCRMPLRKA